MTALAQARPVALAPEDESPFRLTAGMAGAIAGCALGAQLGGLEAMAGLGAGWVLGYLTKLAVQRTRHTGR